MEWQMLQPEMVIHSDGTESWILDGECHREDGPAVVKPNGTKYWYLNGKRHRENGPAIEYPNTSKYWYLNNVLHREDGPAVMYANGEKWWYLNDEEVSWQQVFHNAKGDLEKECRILTYALTDGVVNVAT
jgi:hypothetical protein